jgi:hypothetical protein
VLDALFGPDYLIVPATPAHQRQQIDRFFIHRRDGRLIYRVDYKCDVRAAQTGNLALEHVSVVRHGRREAAGWIHTTIADHIVVYVPGWDRAFVLEVVALRAAWPEILRGFAPRPAATACRRPYQTLICCVPIRWLYEAGLIVHTITRVTAQLPPELRAGQGWEASR